MDKENTQSPRSHRTQKMHLWTYSGILEAKHLNFNPECVDNDIVSPVTTVVCRVSWRRLPLADAGGTIPRQRLYIVDVDILDIFILGKTLV